MAITHNKAMQKIHTVLTQSAYAIFTWLLLQGSAFSADCEKEMATFLSVPNKVNYSNVVTNLGNTERNICWKLLHDIQSKEEKSQDLELLWTHVRKGNEWAIRMVAKSLDKLDGGALEDAYRILGESVNIRPKILLQLYKEKAINQRSFEDCLTMLPLSILDFRNQRIAELKLRERNIGDVKSTQLLKQKKLAISILREQVLNIEKTWPENQ